MLKVFRQTQHQNLEFGPKPSDIQQTNKKKKKTFIESTLAFKRG
jgi:hypothetical protein